MSDSCEDDYESMSEFCDRMGYSMQHKMNPPSLCRPQSPKEDETQIYIWQLGNREEKLEFIDGKKVSIEKKEYKQDAVFGCAIIPEYQMNIRFPIPYKKLNWKDKLKMKIASFILWLANRIGDKNV